MGLPKFLICDTYNSQLGSAKTTVVNTVEFLAGFYYILLFCMGLRNIYVIFYQQKKYSSIIFPLMYLFTQVVCVLQVS